MFFYKVRVFNLDQNLPKMPINKDYKRPGTKQLLLHGLKFNPNPKFLGMAEAYFTCHISEMPLGFQIRVG